MRSNDCPTGQDAGQKELKRLFPTIQSPILLNATCRPALREVSNKSRCNELDRRIMVVVTKLPASGLHYLMILENNHATCRVVSSRWDQRER